MGTIDLKALRASAVKELANIGLGHATTALANMTNRTFEMSVPSAETVPIEELPEVMGAGEDRTVGILVPIVGDADGIIGFFLPEAAARSLIGMVMGTVSEGDLNEVEISMLLEVGNIINSSFLSAISDMTSLRLESTPPRMAIDMSEAILQSIACEAGTRQTVALAVSTHLETEDRAVTGYFVYLPSSVGLERVFVGLGLAEAA